MNENGSWEKIHNNNNNNKMITFGNEKLMAKFSIMVIAFYCYR
jgi:hypothetical protein